MRILRFGEELPTSDECSCGLEHDRTLKVVIISPLSASLNKLSKFGIHGPYGVFYDEITYKVAGEYVVKTLNGEGFLVSAPTFDEAEAKVGELFNLKTVIGVGGGTVIDVAKYAAYKSGSSFVSIPTSPSHDGIASPTASLFNENRRISVKTRAPVVSLIDPTILSTAPKSLKASGFGDILSKVVSLKDWQLGRDHVGEPYCRMAESFTMRALRIVVDSLKLNLSGLRSVEKLAEALIYSGVSMMIAGSSRPASGSEHLISHYLDMKLGRKVPHGIQCALGTLVMSLYHERHNPDWWDLKDFSWRGLRKLMKAAEIPLRLREVGIPKDLMVEAIVEAWKIRPKRYTILHKRRPSREEAEELLREVKLV